MHKLKHGGIPELRFVGRIVGKAIFDRQLINVQFDLSILKSLIGQPFTMEDLEVVDPVYAKSLKWMLGERHYGHHRRDLSAHFAKILWGERSALS